MSLEKIYIEKTVPSYFSKVRQEIVTLFPRAASRVLEIGCGQGGTLAFLKQSGLASWTCGLDIHKDSLEIARKNGVDEVLCGNAEDVALLGLDRKFDVILCLDVLEHLIDPWSVVDNLVDVLEDNGVVIASIPNIQNLRVLFPLIFGQWEYKDCGILDKGHLRFFTKDTTLQLMSRRGLSVEEVLLNPEPHWLPRFANRLTFGVFERFITVQYLVRSKKTPSGLGPAV